MFYIIEYEYVGPFDEYHADRDLIEILTAPVRKNYLRRCWGLLHEDDEGGDEIIEGSCGAMNDVAAYAHGEFPSIESARKFISEYFDGMREVAIEEHRDVAFSCDVYDKDDEPVLIEAYRPGLFKPISREATLVAVGEWMIDDVSAETTDNQIDDLVNSYQANFKSAMESVNAVYVRALIVEYRDDLIAEAA